LLPYVIGETEDYQNSRLQHTQRAKNRRILKHALEETLDPGKKKGGGETSYA